jgi:hypothetical protein
LVDFYALLYIDQYLYGISLSAGICCLENDYGRAIVPVHIRYIKNPGLLYFEEGYGEVLGIVDEEIIKFQKQ